MQYTESGLASHLQSCYTLTSNQYDTQTSVSLLQDSNTIRLWRILWVEAGEGRGNTTIVRLGLLSGSERGNGGLPHVFGFEIG